MPKKQRASPRTPKRPDAGKRMNAIVPAPGVKLQFPSSVTRAIKRISREQFEVERKAFNELWKRHIKRGGLKRDVKLF